VAKKVPEHAETGGGLYVAAVQSAAAIGAFGGGVAFDSSGSTGVFVLSGLSWFLAAVIVYIRIAATTEKTTTLGAAIETHWMRKRSQENNERK
jgi:predicted MFS family arabinose efflux permease